MKNNFALDEEGNYISAEDAQKNKPYKCITCGDRLFLRAGDKKVHHFYHHSNLICTGESDIHKMHKSALLKTKKIFLHNGICWNFLQFDKVELEVPFLNYFIDAVGFLNGKKIFIEFKHTHEIDDVKKQDIIKHKIPCVEISCDTHFISFDILCNLFESDFFLQKIIYSSVIDLYYLRETSVRSEICEYRQLMDDFIRHHDRIFRQTGKDHAGCPYYKNSSFFRFKLKEIIEKYKAL